MTFNESDTVEAYLRDLLCGCVTHHTAVGPGFARRAGRTSGLDGFYLAQGDVSRKLQDVCSEYFVRGSFPSTPLASEMNRC